MPTSLQFKVFNPAGTYVAACRLPEDAAAIVAAYGDGSKIRDGQNTGPVVWHEGIETQPAGESYDFVAKIAWSRVPCGRGATRGRPPAK